MPTAPRGLLHRLQSLAIFTCLLLALLHEMFFLIEPGASLRQALSGKSRQLIAEQDTAQRAQLLIDTADGANLALHFQGFSPDDPWLARFYFLGQYALYPNRAIVGHGDNIINSQSQIAAADIPADDPWLRAHNVHAVLTIRQNDDGSMNTQIRRLH
jgi:hypothetical protein